MSIAAILATAAAALLPGAACAENKGAIMLAVSTDMKAPKDVNVVSVAILVGPEVKYNFVGRVTPEGEVLLPATLAIAEPDDPNKPIKIRVIAFKDTKARVLRDITTTVPRNGRVALLRMPLSFVNDGSGIGSLPLANLPTAKVASFSGGTINLKDLGGGLRPLADDFNPFGADVVSACTDPDQTMIDGECKSSAIDSASLPDFDSSLVSRPDGKCFECTDCFKGWREVTVDTNACTFPKEGDVTNITLVTRDTGDCDAASGNCFIPVDKDDDAGWKDEGATIRLPKGVCKKLQAGARLGVVGGATCDVKSSSFPVCTGVGGFPPDGGVADGGADAGDDADAGDPAAPQLLVAANEPSAVAAYTDRVYYAAHDGLYVLFRGNATPQRLTNSPTTTPGPWTMAQSPQTAGANVVFANGVSATGATETLAYVLESVNPGATATLNAISFSLPTSNHVAGTAVSQTHAFYAVASPFTSGEVQTSGTKAGAAGGQSSPLGIPKSIAYSSSGTDGTIWAGNTSGEAYRCDLGVGGVNLNCAMAAIIVDSANGNPVENIVTTDANPNTAYALSKDGVFLLNGLIGTSVPLAFADLSEINYAADGLSYTRGLSTIGIGRCGFYSSKVGVEYVTADQTTKGILYNANGKHVAGIASPTVQNQTDQHVYFTVLDTVANGGAVWRVKIPDSCL